MSLSTLTDQEQLISSENVAPVSPIGIFTTDVNLNITSWNDWLVRITGLTEESVRGVHITRVVPEIEKKGLFERFLNVLNEGHLEILSSVFHHYMIKIPLKKPVGKFTEMQQRVIIAPLMGEDSVLGTLVTIEDVTSQLAGTGEQSPSAELLQDLSSDDWVTRKKSVESLSFTGKTVIAEVLRKIRMEHRNLNILNSAMKVLALSELDINDFLIEFLNYQDNELRLYAAQMLGDKSGQNVIEALIHALDDPDLNVKYHAIESLGKIRAYQAVDKLAGIALEHDFFTAFPAIDALRSIGDLRAAKLLLPLIKDNILGQPVIEALGELGDADAIVHLVSLINENSPLLDFIIRALVRISERYEETLKGGAYIGDVTRDNLTTKGIENLLSWLDIASEDDLNPTIRVLGWIDDARISMSLARFLGNPGTRKQVIETFVRSGQKVADILISELDSDLETRQAAILALGRIGGDKAAEAIMPLLEDDEVAVICCGSIAKIGYSRAFDHLIRLLAHQDTSIRRAAIAALNSIGHPEMGSRIFSLLSDRDPLIRESAIRIAGYFGFPGTKSIIHRLTCDSDINVRIAAIENLPYFEDERLSSALKMFYDDRDPRVRSAVVKSLGMMESKRVYDVLMQALEDTDGWVRYYALLSIKIQGFPEATDRIRDVAANDPIPFVRLAAIEYLGHTGGALSASILASLTGDPDREIALHAINALGDIHHPDALPQLLALSKSNDVEIKKTAIEALGRRGGPGTCGALQWLAITEKDPEMKQSAITSLRIIGTKEAVIALLNLTSDQENNERAINALAGIPMEMLDILRKGLYHKHPGIRTSTIDVLLRMHTPEASAMLAESLGHPDVNVRLSAVNALHRLGNRGCMKKLLSLRETDPDPAVRKAIDDIIKPG